MMKFGRWQRLQLVQFCMVSVSPDLIAQQLLCRHVKALDGIQLAALTADYSRENQSLPLCF